MRFVSSTLQEISPFDSVTVQREAMVEYRAKKRKEPKSALSFVVPFRSPPVLGEIR